MSDTCAVCGQPLAIGDFPCIYTPRPHGKYQQRSGFEPYFDVGLGQEVTGWGDVRKAMRENSLDFRDHPSKGDLSARKDKAHEARRQRVDARAMHIDPLASPYTFRYESDGKTETRDVVPSEERPILYAPSGRPMRRRAGF